jgi:peptide/nickel transport system permease protein
MADTDTVLPAGAAALDGALGPGGGGGAPPTSSAVSPAQVLRAVRRAGRYAVRHPGLAAAVVIVVIVIGWALFPSLFTSWGPYAIDPVHKLEGPSAEHWFGTDYLGRDVYARVVYGAQLSLQATLLAVAIALIVGSVIGLAGGFFRGAVDGALMRLVDVLLSIPGLLLSLAIITALGPGTEHIAVAVGIAAVGSFARVMRAEVFRVREQLYVEAAVAAGVRWPVVLLRRVLPNSYGPVAALSAVEFGTAILSVSALSFLGYGATPPAPEWGSMVAEGQDYLSTSWWLITMPGLVVMLVVLSASRISRALDGDRGRR